MHTSITKIPFSELVISELEKVLRGDRLSDIRAIGVGSFSRSRTNAVYQMALLEHLRKHFDAPTTSFQEPMVTQTEREYLEQNGISVLEPDDLKPLDGSVDVPVPKVGAIQILL